MHWLRASGRRAMPGAPLFGALLGTVTIALASLPATASALPPIQPDPGAWVTDGSVSSVVHVGSTTYLAGYFDWVGPWTGSGASLSVPGGTNSAAFPRVAGGPILASAPDGSGGVYIGGGFTSVDGQPIANLAHIEANGVLDTSLPNPNGEVTTLAFAPSTGILNFGSLYVGGRFSSIGGVSRQYLAEIDFTLGGDSISDRFAPCPGYSQTDHTSDQPFPFALAVSSTTVYVGGDFDYMDGGLANPTTHDPTCSTAVNSSNLAAISRSTGAVSTTFAPDPGGEVDALALSANVSEVYAGGQFDYTPGPTNSPFLAAYDSTTGAIDSSWLPQAKGEVHALATSGSTLYVGGNFTRIGANAAPRVGVAQLDGVGATANVTSFDAGLQPSVDEYSTGVQSLALDDPEAPTRLAIGGYFATTSGAHHLALVDASTGALATGFKPDPGGLPEALSFLSSSSLFAGGDFNSVGAVYRPGVVALDGYGHPTSTVFAGAGRERTLAVSPDGRTVLASGDGGPEAWSASSGTPLKWTPPYFYSAAFSPDSSLVYVGGPFSTIDGAPRDNLAALSTATGAPSSWSPNPDGAVQALAVSPDGHTVYAGGKFQHIGTSVAERGDLAALSSSSGDVTPWSPNPNGQIFSLDATSDGEHIFAGGIFNTIGAQPQTRDDIADLTTNTGNPTPFAENYAPNNEVDSIATADDNSVIYAGGEFNAIGSTPAHGLAALDGGSGQALSWSPPVGAVYAPGVVAADDDTIWTGNSGTQLGIDLRPYYAQFSTTPTSIAPPALSSSARPGAAVTCVSGGWRNAPATLAVSWQLDAEQIAGASARSYTPTTGQAGHRLTCTETAANPGGSAHAASAAATIAKPSAPTTPKLKLTITVKPKKFYAHKGTRLTVKLSARATLKLTLAKKHLRKHAKRSWHLHAGTNKLKLTKLAPGKYTATFLATSGAKRSNTVTVKLTVLR